jgi:hypothetical protein
MSPEQRIKEQRMIEATGKGYTGALNSKFGCILQFLGKPIKSHSSPLFETSYLFDPYEVNDDEMPTFDDGEMVSELGFFFDGLSRGMHLEIKFIDNDLTVNYKGYLVYKETSGDLEAYFPHPEWEKHIENLYSAAVKLQRQAKKESGQTKIKIEEAEKKAWLHSLWEKWGSFD